MPGLRYRKRGRSDNEELALAAMQAKSEELKVEGVAVVLICTRDDGSFQPRFAIMGRMERDPDPSKDPTDTGVNYIGVALTKLAEMFLTGKNSGTSGKPVKKGELGFRGGKVVYEKDDFFYTAFSGGTQDEDVLIAEAGQKAVLA